MQYSQAATTNAFKSAQARAVFFARIGSGGALFEFLLNPILGKLSDAYGRRAIIPIGTLSVTICRFIMFLWPSRRWPYALEQLVTIPLVTSFFTTYRASLSDAFDGQAYAKAAAQVSIERTCMLQHNQGQFTGSRWDKEELCVICMLQVLVFGSLIELHYSCSWHTVYVFRLYCLTYTSVYVGGLLQ